MGLHPNGGVEMRCLREDENAAGYVSLVYGNLYRRQQLGNLQTTLRTSRANVGYNKAVNQSKTYLPISETDSESYRSIKQNGSSAFIH
jgi:hypothetical protein